MTDYAIGDIQGCYERLRDVLEKVDFSPSVSYTHLTLPTKRIV